MSRPILFACLVALSGCVSMAKIESGEHTIGERLVVKIEGAWNHLDAPGIGPAQTWTMEGLPVDQLLIYSGIKDGELIHAQGSGRSQKTFAFRSGMEPDQIVALFQGMLTRDGSAFKLAKLEPSTFGGLKGLRFQYTLTRREDNVVLSGVAWAAVSRGELFAILYTAPRLAFFSRHVGEVEKIAASALVKG